MTASEPALPAAGDAARRRTAVRLAVAALFFGGFLTAGSGVFIKLSEIPPTATGFYRLCLSAPLLWLWLSWERPRRAGFRAPRDWRERGQLAFAGLLYGVNTGLWCWCMHYTTVANGQLIASMSPIYVTLGAFVFLKERFTRAFLLGLALTVAGVALLMVQSAAVGSAPVTGDLLALGGSLFWSTYLLALQRLRRTFSTATIMTWTAVVASIVLLAAAAAGGEQLVPATLRGWAVVCGLAFVSQVAGQSFITYALALLPASFSALGLLIQPIYAALIAWPVLGEAPVPLQIVGGAVVLSGILLARPLRRP